MDKERFRERGTELIDNPEHDMAMIPIKEWEDFPLRFTVEYPVKEFEEEAGFWAEAFGVRFLSLNEEYAICTDDKQSYTFSFRRSDKVTDLSLIRIQWFTDNLNDVISVLNDRNIPNKVYYNSPNQRYLRTESPAGITVEVWSGLEYHCP